MRPFHEIGQFIQLLARVFGSSRHADAADPFALVEDAELALWENLLQGREFHAETQVRFIRTVFVHGRLPAHPLQRRHIDAFFHLEQVTDQAFEHLQHVFLFHERHLAVQLREFRLAVGPEVFIAEAAHQLEVAVVTGYHQKLLVLLRRLRQRVEFARVHARRHHEVARAFRGGFHQERRFDFHEALTVHVFADFDAQTVAQFQVLADAVAAQVQVAVLHPQLVAPVAMVLDRERRGLGRVQDIDFIGNDFNVPGRNLAVLVASFGHLAFDLHHEFTAQGTGFGAQVGIGFHIEYDLGDAVAVPQVHEGHASQVAGTLHPAAEADFFSDVRNPEFAVGMCPVHFLIELMADARIALNQAYVIRLRFMPFRARLMGSVRLFLGLALVGYGFHQGFDLFGVA